MISEKKKVWVAVAVVATFSLLGAAAGAWFAMNLGRFTEKAEAEVQKQAVQKAVDSIGRDWADFRDASITCQDMMKPHEEGQFSFSEKFLWRIESVTRGFNEGKGDAKYWSDFYAFTLRMRTCTDGVFAEALAKAWEAGFLRGYPGFVAWVDSNPREHEVREAHALLRMAMDPENEDTAADVRSGIEAEVRKKLPRGFSLSP